MRHGYVLEEADEFCCALADPGAAGVLSPPDCGSAARCGPC
jgi:hypothetical protein